MRRHLWAFTLLAGAVIAPALVLLYYGVSSWKGEVALERARERDQHGLAADAIAMRIRKEMRAVLAAEHERPYYEYRGWYFMPPGVNARTNNIGNFGLMQSKLADVPEDSVVKGYFQLGSDDTLRTPVLVANPVATKEQVAGAKQYLSRLTGVSRAFRAQQQRGWQQRERQGPAPRQTAQVEVQRDAQHEVPSAQTEEIPQSSPSQTAPRQTSSQQALSPQGLTPQQIAAATFPMNCTRVDRQTFEANRDVANWYNKFELANGGDAAAEAELKRFANGVCFDTGDSVDVVCSPFEIVTLDRDGPKDPLIVAIRRVEERDRKAPDRYYQGFELNLKRLRETVFPEAINGVPARNFVAHVALRSADGDRSLVRDLGPLLPAFELRAAPREPEAAVRAVAIHQRNFYWIMSILGAAVIGALFLFWRLLSGEVELGKRRQDFASAVTHELKTPLTSIRMYAELLEDRWVEDEAKQQRYFGTIRRESERLTRLIGNVLDFSRLERGRDVLKPSTVDPAQVVRETVEPLKRAMASAERALRIDAPASMEPFVLDRDAFTQIIINLVDNAVKYGDPNGAVDVALARDGDTLALTVENDGEAIPRKLRATIFEDFRRGRGRRIEEVAGVGLGLALVRRFARAHGGDATHQDGRGRPSFLVTLRALPAPGDARA